MRAQARLLRKIMLWLMFALFVLVVVAAWLAGREWTLQYVIADVMQRTQGDLKIVGARGGLYEGLMFDRLEVHRPNQVIVLEKGVVLWEPTMFFSKTLKIRQAEVARISIEVTRKSTDPAVEPASLEIPINLDVPLAKIGTLEYRDAGTVTTLSAIEIGMRYSGKHWQIQHASVETPWGIAKAAAELDATKPYALKGELAFAQERGETPYRVTAALNGKLSDIGVGANFSLKDSSRNIAGSATATLAPFKPQPLVRAGVKVPQLALRNFDATLPEAMLAFDATLEPTSNDSFKGVIDIRNSVIGTLDAQRLPLTTAHANFAGDMKQINVSELLLDLGTGGQFRGAATYRNDSSLAVLDRITLALNTQNLNLNGVHAKLRKTAIKGEATIKPDKGGVNINGAFREAKLALNIDARADRDAVQVARAELTAGAGRLAFNGNMKLKGSRDFQVAGTLKKFNPADFGDYPAADLNADIAASGSAAEAWRVKLESTIGQSRFMGQPLSGKANLIATTEAVRDVDVALALGANRVAATGSMTAKGNDSGAKLDWKIDAPQLGQLHRDLAGNLSAKGSATGAYAAPTITAEVDGKELLLFAEHRIKSVIGRVQIALKAPAKAGTVDAKDAALSADITVNGYVSPKISLDRATAKLDGTRLAHTLALSATNADFNVRLEGKGALDAANRWSGDITRLDNRGNVPFNLLSPATLSASSDGRIHLGAAHFDVSGGKLDIEQFRMAGGAIATSGKGSALPLAVATQFSDALKRNIDTTLKLGAEWNIATAAATSTPGSTPVRVSGRLRVFRESGDIRFLSEPPFAAGLDALDIKADVADNLVTASLNASGKQLGKVDVNASTRAERRGEVWGIPANAPLQLKGDIDVPSLAWVMRVAGQPGLSLDGKLRASVTGSGTFGSPQLTGRAQGSALAFGWPDQGVNYKNGVLDAEFSENTLLVKKLSMTAGEGTLEAEGKLAISGVKSTGTLKVKVDRFEAVSRPDRQVVASGEGNLALDENRISVNAKVKAERGFFELPEKSDITISDDIVIIGKAAPADRKESKMTTQVNLDIDMGREFRIRGAGLTGRLEGTLHVASAGIGLPRAVGTLTVEEGTYAVYGQKLEIERGVLTFAGPIHNPGVDLYAVRKNPQPSLAGNTVEAGVEVRGSALTPRAKLVSTPNVPDTEKLSWLVLGRGLESSSQTDFSLLSTAASGLLGGGQGAAVQARIAGALGVDEFGISPPGVGTGGLLTLGKRISSRLFVAYEQGLGKVSNILKVRYTLSKRWAVQAQAGTESAVDALFTISFD